MKKLITGCVVSLLPLSVFSQTMVREMDGAHTRFITGGYMKDGKAAIYFSSNEYGYDDGEPNFEARIFDFELNPLKTFAFQILQPYTLTEKREATGTRELTRETESVVECHLPYGPTDDMLIRREVFCVWYMDNYAENGREPYVTVDGLWSNSRVEGSDIIITYPSEWLGWNYLTSREVRLSADDKCTIRSTYARNVTVYDGQWVQERRDETPISNFCTPRCYDVANLNDWNGGVYLPFSQTFFNDDDKFEYVRFIAEVAEGYGDSYPSVWDPSKGIFGITDNDRDGDGEEDYRQTQYGVHYSGLEVVSEDGTVLFSFPLPEGVDVDDVRVEFFKSDDNILAQIEFDRYDEESYMTKHTVRFYRMDRQTGVPQIIHEESSPAAFPNPASSGVPVELTLPESENMRTVSVFNMNGEKLYSRDIERGVSVVRIPTAGFSQGLYLFSIFENGVKADTVKIIIR